MADIMILAALLVCTAIGVWRGLLDSMAGVVIVVLAFFGASMAADALSAPVAEWIEPVVSQRIEEKIQSHDATDANGMLSEFHFTGEHLRRMAEDVMEKVETTGITLITGVVESVTRSVAYAAVFLVAFLVLLLGLHLALKPLELMTRLPGLHMLNCLGGGALGLVWGALLVFLAVWLLLRFDWIITAEMLASSPVLRFFAENSPVSLLTSL